MKYILKDTEDDTYLRGIMGEGWTNIKLDAYKFTFMSAQIIKYWALVSNRQNLIAVEYKKG